MKTILGTAAALAVLSCATAARAQDTTSLSFTTGVDVSKGDYGTGINTDILVAPLSARLKLGDVRITASVPWLRINGASAIVPGDGGPVIIDPLAPRTTRNGLGDVTLGLNWALPQDKLGVGLDLGARFKIPTASASKGLGTGKADVALSAEISRSFGAVTAFISTGYRFVGSPDTFALDNAFFGSAGLSVSAGKLVLIISYDYRQAASPLAQDSQEIFGALSAPLTERFTLTAYGTGGLSKGAPDYGLGLMVTVKAF